MHKWLLRQKRDQSERPAITLSFVRVDPKRAMIRVDDGHACRQLSALLISGALLRAIEQDNDQNMAVDDKSAVAK